MELRNLTPFSVMNYRMLDTEDKEYHVVAMKVGYQLLSAGKGEYLAELLPVMSLCVQDQYRGALNVSQVLQESDLAPFKPKCDVIVNGTAYAPEGQPCPAFPVRLLLTDANGDTLLDKTLEISGEREFFRTDNGQWQLSEPKPFDRLPLDYRYAFGGECRIEADDDEAANALTEDDKLSPEQRSQHPDGEQAPIAHAVLEYNPIGSGFILPWYAQAKDLPRYAAPRITRPDAPITAPHFAAMLSGHLPATEPACQPQGMGVIGRAWLPRRTLAGTYDQTWLDERHPYLPQDFDFGYWNGAPQDQQIDWPSTDITLQLTNLTPDGSLQTQLPGHRPFILFRMEDGALLPVLMNLDTLIIDTDAMTLELTFHLNFSIDLPVRVIEARFEINPKAPLITFAPEQEQNHGG
ncbi:DUF2169 family type VI secretion system accessory protein [Xenorhabdus bovienii]|uniref:DUF2169 family type VI secretion system accessory protein n=1 Tax=Xenorhabdus bovienii TaxID=40576 RepID=UPI0023B3158C|nr:DUF2169 domain-containing protein [Xenorhabdus bovienii]MDE9457606.1 DUF2169 domain-containing protein [Xenorhabdus bovienii]MDE9514483.1 DUF2169 domain-containing protein [Xenorhabdus bovienii]